MRRLEKNPLELIIIPIHMPEKSKLWTRGYCRQLNPRKGLPVVGSPYTYGNIRMKIWGGGGLQPKKNRTLPQISNLGLVFFGFFCFFFRFFRFFHFGQF